MGIGALGRRLFHRNDEPEEQPKPAQATPTPKVEVAAPRPPPPGPRSYPLAGDAGLAKVASGATLASGAKGTSVERVQEALTFTGGKLPRYGADGLFGAETAAALRSFQTGHALPPTGVLDAKTLAALDDAPKTLKSPRYDKLLADGVLQTTLAIGYDEAGSHEVELPKVLDGLAARGYHRLDVAKASAETLKRLGITDTTATYFTKELTRDGKPFTAVVHLISSHSPNAEAQFAAGLAHDELVLYGGHGRYGSGPDFDDITSPAGNFVIGAPSSPGHVTLGPSSLAKTKLTDGYQLMFFDACNTFRYVDDLRAVPKNKSSANLDIVGTTTELYWDRTAENVLAMLDGVTKGESIQQVRDELDAIDREGPDDRRHLFMTDGFDDN